MGIVSGVRDRKWTSLIGGSLLMTLALWLSFGALAIVGLVGVWSALGAHARWKDRRRASRALDRTGDAVRPGMRLPWRRALIPLAIALASGITAYAAVGYNWFAHFLSSGVLAAEGGRGVKLPFTEPAAYLPWLGGNVMELVVFCGLPLLVLAGRHMLRSVREIRRGRGTALHRMAVAVGMTIVVLWLSGITRGEVARIWMFLFPFIAVLAAGEWERVRLTDARIARIYGIAQCGLAFATVVFIVPVALASL
jgi:hypothetical protein